VENIAFHPVVIAPTYNNAGTLSDVIARVQALGLPLIVVNDGSTDETAAVLKSALAGVTVLSHSRNRGKAAALQTGFAAAAASHTHALSIDTDGQHDPAEIPKLLDRARREPEAFVLGLRDESAPGYPAKSRLGRRLSNLFIQMESGLRVEDSQCGMRVYPLGLVQAVRCGAGRYGFETEIVTRAAWAGCKVIEVPLACHYLPDDARVSHLNPWLDTFRAIGMHARLLTRALLPWRHPQWPARAAVDSIRSVRWNWRRLFHWLNPAEAWRQARRDRVSREAFSAGLATGAFVGNLPTYGLHAFIGLYIARRLHLHPVAVVIGSQISTPPIGPLLNAAAIALGHVILHGSLPTSADFDIRANGFLYVFRRMLLEWAIGSPIVGLVCAVAVFVISNRLLQLAAAKDSRADTQESSADHPTGPAPGHVA
jgi:glycosyltransferase involved in cell wall biosynthesis